MAVNLRQSTSFCQIMIDHGNPSFTSEMRTSHMIIMSTKFMNHLHFDVFSWRCEFSLAPAHRQPPTLRRNLIDYISKGKPGLRTSTSGTQTCQKQRFNQQVCLDESDMLPTRNNMLHDTISFCIDRHISEIMTNSGFEIWSILQILKSICTDTCYVYLNPT